MDASRLGLLLMNFKEISLKNVKMDETFGYDKIGCHSCVSDLIER